MKIKTNKNSGFALSEFSIVIFWTFIAVCAICVAFTTIIIRGEKIWAHNHFPINSSVTLKNNNLYTNAIVLKYIDSKICVILIQTPTTNFTATVSTNLLEKRQ